MEPHAMAVSIGQNWLNFSNFLWFRLMEGCFLVYKYKTELIWGGRIMGNFIP